MGWPLVEDLVDRSLPLGYKGSCKEEEEEGMEVERGRIGGVQEE